MKRQNETRDELIIAFRLYLNIPFSKIHFSHPEIINHALLINRTPSSIAIRLSNFAHVDPHHRDRGVVGLSAGAKTIQPIWDDFINDNESLLFESERIRAEKENSSIVDKYSNLLSGTDLLVGETRIQEIKARVNQQVFRNIA
jgi:putative restriction endonuclease